MLEILHSQNSLDTKPGNVGNNDYWHGMYFFDAHDFLRTDDYSKFELCLVESEAFKLVKEFFLCRLLNLCKN